MPVLKVTILEVGETNESQHIRLDMTMARQALFHAAIPIDSYSDGFKEDFFKETNANTQSIAELIDLLSQ